MNLIDTNSTYLGTSGWTEINALALDATGQVHVAGRMDDNTVVPNSSVFLSLTQNTQHPANRYAFAAKLNASGTDLLYFTRYGGSQCDTNFCYGAHTWANAIALDTAGNAWITGPTASNMLPLSRPLVTQYSAVGDTPDLYVAKLNTAGNGLLFASLLGGVASSPGNSQHDQQANAIAVDALGSVYIAGATNRSDFPTTAGAFQSTVSATAGTAAFVVKINETKDTFTSLTVSPTSGLVGTSFTLTATVTGNNSLPNPGGSIDFYDGVTLLGSVALTTAPPMSPVTAQWTTNTLPTGNRSLSARYAGDARHFGSAGYAGITVSIPPNPDGIPTLVVTGQNGLADGATLLANAGGGTTYTGAQVTLTANAALGNTLNDVRITRVGGDSAYWNPQAPAFSITYTFPDLATGLHIYQVSVTDNQGHTVTAPLRFAVNPATATPPSIAITSPINNATFTAPATIPVTVNATPAPGHTITRVLYIQNDFAFSVSTTAPFSSTWSNVAAGTYSLMAMATDNTGAVALSAPVNITVTPALGVPGAPVLLSATPGMGSATLTFSAPAGNGSAPITGYTGTCTASGQPIATDTAAANATTVTITGMAGGVTYTCTVAATNSAGTGSASNSLGVTPTAALGVPGAPTLVSATPGTGSATLTFNAPANSGGSAITGYTGTCAANGQATATDTAAANATTVTITGMAGGVTYTCTVAAGNSAGTGAASNSLAVTPTAAPAQSIAITSPAHNATVGSASPVDIVVNANVAPNTIAKIEIFDGATLLTTFTPTATSSLILTVTWPGRSVGSHTLTAKVTDSLNNVVTSAPVTVQVVASPTISLSTLSNFYLAGSTVDLNTTTSASQPATVAKVEFFANDGMANTLIGTVTTAPYSFRWQNVMAGSYTFTARVTDSQMLATTSAGVGVTVGSAVAIQFAGGLNGSTVDDDTVFVSGSTTAPPNSAVSINGQLATVTREGQFFLNDLNLQAGTNTVTATVTTQDGQTANQVIAITRSATPAAQYTVTVPASGIVNPPEPFFADVTIARMDGGPLPAGHTMTLQCVDGGQVVNVAQLGTSHCWYAGAGVVTITVTIKDAVNVVVYSTAKKLVLKSAASHLDFIANTFATTTDRLRAGNIDGALALFGSTVREKYRAAFVEAGAGIANLVNSFGPLSGATFSESFAELVIIKTTAQGTQTALVILALCPDGFWRIDGF